MSRNRVYRHSYQSYRLRQRFLARFGERTELIESYRRKVEALFGRHTQDSVITGAVNFSHFFTLAEEYRARDQYLAAAVVYRALFETIDENTDRIDAAYDHYTKTLQTALNEYVKCVLTADASSDDVERYASVLENRLQGTGVYHEVFQRALDDLRTGRDGSNG